MTTGWLDALRKKLGWDKNKPAPDTKPVVKPGVVDYLKALKLFKNIDISKLGPVIGLSLLLVFFAISGVLAWIVVAFKFMTTLAR